MVLLFPTRARARKRVAAAGLALSLCLPAGLAWAQVPDPASGGGGVVVEAIQPGNTLLAAGVRPGDILLAWERSPSPSAPPEPNTAGELGSPFDWFWMVTEPSMRGALRLAGQRQGQPLSWTVPLGYLEDAEVRPVLPSEMLEPYRRGRAHFQRNEIPEAIDCWRWLAEALRQRGDWRGASWLSLALAEGLTERRIWHEAEESFEAALMEARDARAQDAILYRRGDFYLRQGRFAEAEDDYLARLRLEESTWGESLKVAESLAQLGWSASRQGRIEAATEYYQQALALQEKLAPRSPVVAKTLTYLGFAASDRGQLAVAEHCLGGALSILQKLSPDSQVLTSHLSNLADIYLLRGDVDFAEELFRQALQQEKKVGGESRCRAYALNQLGNIAIYRQDGIAARDFLLRSLHLAEKLSPDSYDMSQILVNLGRLALEREDLAAAESYFQRALAIVERLGLVISDRMVLLTELGSVSARRGDLDRAERYFRESLAFSQRLAPESSQRAETLHLLASVLRRKHAIAEAESELAQALEILEAQVDHLGGSLEGKGAFRAQNGDIYRDAVRMQIEMDRPREAFRLLERFRAQAFLALLAERDLTFAADILPALDRDRRRLTTLYDGNELRLATLDPNRDGKAIETLRREQLQLRRKREEIDAEKNRTASPRLSAMVHPETLTFEEVRTALDPGTVMLSYSVGKEKTELFVVTPGKGLAARTLPVGEEDLRQEVTHLRQLVEQTQSASGLNAAGLEWESRRLYRLLVQPAEPWIATGRRIVVVPDGPLHLLPFAALIDRNGKYLIEKKPLHTALSGTVYAELRERRRHSSATTGTLQWVGFGDPWFPQRLAQAQPLETEDTRLRSFSTRTGLHWQRLPESRREVERIADLYPTTARQVYLDREATEERAKTLGPEARIVHFATHAFVDDRSPFDSGLVLAIPDQFVEGHDNGLLQVWEIFESVRLDADLVVLSACETGLGEIRGGEGIIGLTRAFQYAGARSVLASLWRVDDRATAELMERFYRHLRGGERKDEALRAAQLEMIAKKAATPYFWAAMQLYGDWQ